MGVQSCFVKIHHTKRNLIKLKIDEIYINKKYINIKYKKYVNDNIKLGN